VATELITVVVGVCRAVEVACEDVGVEGNVNRGETDDWGETD